MTSVDPASARPRIAIVGAGAIGTVMADALSGAADVMLCRRTATERMTLELDGERRVVDAGILTRESRMTPVDWVVITTKAQDTAGIGVWLEELVDDNTRVVVLQNGIGHASRVARWVPEDRVVPGIVYIAAEKLSRDLVICREATGITLPAGAAGREFAALVGASVPVRLADDFQAQAWSKLIMNVALNPLTTLTDRTMEVTADEELRPIVQAMLSEGVDVARAEGVGMPQDATVSLLAQLDRLPRNGATSMQLDRRNGRALEYTYLTGAMLAAADRHAVPVPHVRTVHGLLAALKPTALLG
ncbi:MAG TPA: 2-dehydropantoate 2-reductase [Lacisediminihabitans sp.]|uniref:ketopantoate reductase family protein n=1 Tax=Lacisediminihabitans sp. TaxID=2787631 RepID=UPI002ED9067B